MARLAHAISMAWHRIQIPAASQPRGLDRNLRYQLSGSSRPSRLPTVTLPGQRVLVDAAVLHDDEVLLGVCDAIDTRQRIAVDQQQVCERFGDAYQRTSEARISPCRCASAPEDSTSVPHAVLILYFFARSQV